MLTKEGMHYFAFTVGQIILCRRNQLD